MKESLKYMAWIVVAVFVFLTARTLVLPHDKTNGDVSVHDTVWLEREPATDPPLVQDSALRDSIPYPVPVPIYIPGSTDNVRDTVYATIPIVQTHFSYPDKADLWVSGFRVTIDSAVFFTRHEEHNVTTTIDKSHWFNCYIGTDLNCLFSDWNYSLYFEADATIRQRATIGAKAGFMIINNSAEPYIGATFKYKLN